MRKGSIGAQGFKNLPVFASSTFIAIICLLLTGNSASAQARGSNSGSSHESERAAQVRALNNSVLQLHGQVQENASGAAGTRGQAATVLAQRAAALRTLIQEDPHAALSFAFSPELLADLAAKFPGSAAQLESHATLSGPIEHWVFDNVDIKTSHSEYRMKVGTQSLSLHFGRQEPNLAKGQVFQVTGVVLGSDMAVAESSTIPPNGAASFAISAALLAASSLHEVRWLAFALISLLAFGLLHRTAGRIKFSGYVRQFAACCAIAIFALNPGTTFAQTSACSTIGAQNVAVLLVTFPGVTPPANITQQSVYDMFFGTTGPSLDGYWRATSYGQTYATGNAYGWYTLDASYATCSNMAAIRDAAVAAAANAGVPIQTYNRIFIVNTDLGCGWTGLALGQCTTLNSPNGSFTASTSFLDASWQRSQTEGAQTAAHEAGHNMGLDHAQSRTYGTEPLGPLAAAGTLTEYGDDFSDMASSNIGHYAIPHKAEILNWISPGTNYQTVQSGGTWTLQPLEVNPAGLVALKVQRGTGNNAWLWIEYRQNISAYDSIWNPSGALIHYEDSTTDAHTQLLDFTPATSSLYDGALMPGSTWTDPYSNVSISVQSATASGLTVSVNYSASSSCNPIAPTVTASPLNPSIYPGQTASYSISVTNNDSSGCSPSAFNLASTQPSGWSTSFSAPSLSLSPGQSAIVTMGKGAPSGTPAGTYAVNMSAADSASSGTDTANATVITPPSLGVSVSVPGTAFTVPGTVPIAASVTNGGLPGSGASVVFTLTAPNGKTTIQTASTSAAGIATWNYKLNTRSQTGTYSVLAQAALSSGSKKTTSSAQPVTSNTATFTVQ